MYCGVIYFPQHGENILSYDSTLEGVRMYACFRGIKNCTQHFSFQRKAVHFLKYSDLRIVLKFQSN